MTSSGYVGDRMQYVAKVVDPIVEELVHDILATMPPDPVEYSIQWMKKKGGRSVSKRLSLADKNEDLKDDLKRTAASVQEIGELIRTEAKSKGDDDDSSEESDGADDVDELPMPVPTRRGPRTSVSAEAYGAFNTFQEVTLPVHQKSADQKNRLQEVLSLSFLFSDLEEKELGTILDAFEEKAFVGGERIITEGDDGDCLYVVENGSLECKKVIDGAEKVVKTCVPGDVFGELALLYNCPRAANVDAAGRCVCWRLDRQTFNQVVKTAHSKRSDRYDEFVQKVGLFSTLEQAERMRIVECFKIVRCAQGESVVKQGEEGDRFFIVEEGNLVARKSKPGEEAQTVMEYGPGDYFGELALLKNQPRAATIAVTSTKAKLVWLDRRTFIKMLGPLQDILERRAASYA